MYTDEPIRSFVVEVELTSDVDGGVLQEAVDDVLGRAPYFADALVEREGTFYYAKNPLPFEVDEGPLRAIAGPETNWHCLDVTYEGTVMSFAMYHPYCDGLGLNSSSRRRSIATSAAGTASTTQPMACVFPGSRSFRARRPTPSRTATTWS